MAKELPANVDPETGEMGLKVYEFQKHLKIKDAVERQLSYVNKNLRNPKDPDAFARLSPDILSNMLLDFAGMYEYLSGWLANEKLHIADLKTSYDLKFAQKYIDYKDEGKTNETSRMLAKIDCGEDEQEINTYKHGYDVIEAWKKSIGRYHDSVRSQLSYEKSMWSMNKGS